MLLQKNFWNDKFLESSHTTYVEILKIFLTWCQSSESFVFKSINRYKVIFHNLLLVAFSLVKYKLKPLKQFFLYNLQEHLF